MMDKMKKSQEELKKELRENIIAGLEEMKNE